MTKHKGLLSSGWAMIGHNKRYIFWFWLLNLTLAEFGTSAFRKSAHSILDQSLLSDRLVHGVDVAVVVELLNKPDFGQMSAMTTPALYFAFLFLLFTALLLPGVFQGFASTYRLPREDFFRACGRNLWRFIRLMIVAGIVMGIAAAALFGLHGVLERWAAESTNELLLPVVQLAGLAVIFLIMTAFRIWFDLAEADIVLNDQRAVRKSIAVALRHTIESIYRLVASYVVTTIVAAIMLVSGLWVWMKFVAPESVIAAFLLAQLTLLLLLIPRFWQRAIAVSYWQQKMMLPVVTEPSGILPITPRVEALPVPASAMTTVPPPTPSAPPEPPAL